MVVNQIVKIYTVLCIVSLVWQGCLLQSNMKSEVKKELLVFERIGVQLKKDSLVNKKGFLYTDSIHDPIILKDIKLLKDKQIITDYTDRPGRKDRYAPTSIYIAGINHITFFLKLENIGFNTYEHLLIYHSDGGNELIGINRLYSVNQNEEVNDMEIKVYKLDGSSTYIVIKHDKITGL
jgi:hypothetical protein